MKLIWAKCLCPRPAQTFLAAVMFYIIVNNFGIKEMGSIGRFDEHVFAIYTFTSIYFFLVSNLKE